MTYIESAAPSFIRQVCISTFSASVLSFRDKQEFFCKTATVIFSFPCLRAWSLNKGLQLISCEPKWNASAIQSSTLKRFQLGRGPQSWGWGVPAVWQQRLCPSLPLLGWGEASRPAVQASSRDKPSPSCVWDHKTVSSPGQRGTWATTSSVGQGYGLKQMKEAPHFQGCWFNPIKLLLDWPIFAKNLSNESMALNLDYSCEWWTEKQTEEKD